MDASRRGHNRPQCVAVSLADVLGRASGHTGSITACTRSRSRRARAPAQVATEAKERSSAGAPGPRPTQASRWLPGGACFPRRLFRKRSRVRQRGRSWWVSRSEGRGGLGGGEADGPDRAFPGPSQAPAAAIWWLWSFSRLWVAVISRHSARAADLPRRWKRSMRRLNFVCPNTGSIIAWRFR